MTASTSGGAPRGNRSGGLEPIPLTGTSCIPTPTTSPPSTAKRRTFLIRGDVRSVMGVIEYSGAGPEQSHKRLQFLRTSSRCTWSWTWISEHHPTLPRCHLARDREKGMSFTIRPDEGISKAIRRVARAQLGKAADTLRDGGQPLCQRIHLMRTSIKRVRALIALARPAAPHGARRADRRLRRLAGATSELRDAEVVLMTLDGVWPAPTGIRKDTRPAGIRAELAARLSTLE